MNVSCLKYTTNTNDTNNSNFSRLHQRDNLTILNKGSKHSSNEFIMKHCCLPSQASYGKKLTCVQVINKSDPVIEKYDLVISKTDPIINKNDPAKIHEHPHEFFSLRA